MASEIIFVVDESPEGGYGARALGHSIFTEADTLDELNEAIVDAIRCHFDESDAPRICRLRMVKRENSAVRTARVASGSRLAAFLRGLGYAITRKTDGHILLIGHERGEHKITVPKFSSLREGTLSSVRREVVQHCETSKGELARRLWG